MATSGDFRWQLTADQDELLFCGPGGSNGIPVVHARGCQWRPTGASTGWWWLGPSCPTWTRMVPATCATPSRPGWRMAASRLG
jgi:hypothetical protein